MRRTLAALCLLLGCGPVLEGSLPAGPRPAVEAAPGTEGTFRAGAARVDITPPPGYAMAGHPISGAQSVGVWTRLQARSIAFEDERGIPLVLVSTDLAWIPGGLSDAVAERVAADPRGQGLGRDNIVVTASHTHHGPGQFSSNRAFNRFGSIDRGFDPDLFAFLTERVSESVLRALEARQPARLRRRDVAVPTIARNRSVEAFVANPEASELLRANATLPGCGPPDDAGSDDAPKVDRCHAVDPVLTTLEVVSARGSKPIAVAGFFAVQPTAMPDRIELYHGDLFATASARARAELTDADGTAPVIAWFNGAAGDVSPDWDEQGRTATVRLGYALGEALASSLQQPGVELTGTIGLSHSQVALANARSSDGPTGRRGYLGAAALGGPEDGRTRFWRRGYREGKATSRERRRGQGPKRPALGFAAQALAAPASAIPRTVPIGVVSVGPMVLATVPGEASTVMGRRIADRIAAKRTGAGRVVVMGFASEYAGHFTTPQEYDEQHFEGAWTLYGPASGTAIADGLERLAGDPRRFSETTYRYRPGRTSRWSGTERGRWTGRLEGVAVRVRGDLDLLAGRPFVSLSFDDAWVPWPLGGPDIDATPRVRVLSAGVPVRVDGVPIDDEGDEFALWVKEIRDDRWSWTVTWMVPRGAAADAPLQLEIRRVTGDVVCSQPFTLAQVYAGEHTLRPELAECEVP